MTQFKKTLKGLILDDIKTADHGRTLGELYRKFPKFSQRGIRAEVSVLKNDKQVQLELCRCRAANIYLPK